MKDGSKIKSFLLAPLIGLRCYFSTKTQQRHYLQLRSSLAQCLFIRTLVLSVVIATTILEIKSGRALNALFVLSGVAVSITILQALLLKLRSYILYVAYFQFIVDVALATAVISITGSLSTFSLYLLVIIGAAVSLRQHGAVIIAAASGIAYGLLAGGVVSNHLGESFSHLPSIATVYVMLVIIALLCAKFTRHLEIMDVLAASKEKELESLTLRHSLLFEDISNGVISVDDNYRIINVNRSARRSLELYGSDDSKPVGENLFKVLEELGVENPLSLLEIEKGNDLPKELSLLTKNSKTERYLQYSVREILDTDGAQKGAIIIFQDISDLRNIEEKLLVHERMARLLSDPSQHEPSNNLQQLMIGESPIMGKVFELVEKVSRSDASVLITGESGTGKELIARAIHRSSSRKSKPFIAINCGAIPENLIESELFGHTKGSFTGAIDDSLGLFRQANGGTIFLDEIGELPLSMQAKLLRVLQERSVRAVGSSKDIAIDVRILSATNKNLAKEAKLGSFREDLFYRINVVNIPLPPLRQRKEDIPLLISHFIAKYSNPDFTLPQVSPETLQLLLSYSYPGNVRELENIIERAIVLDGKALLPEHLPEVVLASQTVSQNSSNSTVTDTEIIQLPMSLEEILAGLEKQYLTLALNEAGGVKTKAAELLGLNFRSFRYRLKKYGMAEAEQSDSEPN